MLKDYIYEFSEKNRTGTDIPVYSVTNTRGFCKGFFDKEVASSDRSSYKIVPYGFFAYNPSRINVGSIAWQDKEEKAIVSPLYVVFGIDEKKVGQDYLMYYLKSPAVNHRINVLATGTIRKNLKLPVLGEFPFNAPSLDEQKKIVAELDLLSGVIEKQKTELKELGNLAQSTFYDMFGDPIENPKGWETRPLNEVAPQRPYEGTVPDVNGKYWLLNLDKVVSQSGDVLEKEMVDLNEIGNSVVAFDSTNVLYSKLRPYLNKVVIPNDFGYATSELVPLKPNRECLDRVFLTFLLRSKSFVNLISVRVAGAKMPRVSMDFLRNFEVILPPLDLQQSFADKIASIEKQKAALTQSIAETQKLLDYTMDKYFG